MRPLLVSLQTQELVSLQTHTKERKKYTKEILCKDFTTKKLCRRVFLKITLHYNALILEFINRVRMANKLKAISETRAVKIATALSEVAGKYGAENMAAGIQAAFKKHERGGFNFSGHDPAAYVRAVAKSERAGHDSSRQRQLIRHRKRH